MECDLSHRAVNMALWCNFLVFSLKFGVWISTSSHVMLAELVHSIADFANQVSFFRMPVDVYTFPLCFITKNKES
jgi:divalent metal cation (Fe/Co/Zn/Cd) transporter